MQVIGAGFGRTGTLSLKVALETLGFGPCYHMLELFEHPEHVLLWQAAAKGEPVDWDTVFAKYQATVDWPGCAFYEQLVQRYPEAKVVLTIRDSERWYESTKNSIYVMHKVSARNRLSSAIFSLMRRFNSAGRVVPMINALIWNGTFGGNFADKNQAITIFERHIQAVKGRIPAENLLVYDVKQGWEPLCQFLHVPVPEGIPFPHLNDRSAFRQRIRQRQVQTFAALVAAALLAVLAIGTFLLRLRRGSAR